MQQIVYLFDSKFYKDKDLLLFGYMKDPKLNYWRKVEIHVKSYKIAMQMNVDCNLFKQREKKNESWDMVDNYIYKQNPTIQPLVKSYRLVEGFLPFKGAQTPENQQKIVEFEFQEFKYYEQFARKINELNEKIVNNNNSEYFEKWLLKEAVHLTQYLSYEQSKYHEEQIEYQYLQYLLQQFKNRPNKGTKFFEDEERKVIRSNENIKVELIRKLASNYSYQVELVKFPFRMMEDDSKSNYILKLIRQSQCQLAGFNTIEVSNQFIPEDPSQRIQLECDSLDQVQFLDSYINQCPLTILCWDIEVCTETGKFDNDGKNLLNKVLCIGLSFGYLQGPKDQNKRINICLTWVDSNDEQISLDSFISIYTKSIMENRLFTEDFIRIIRVNNEVDMIHGFFKLVNLFDPSFVTGFNDYQFDFPFIKDKISTFNTQNGKYKITQLLYRGFFTQYPQKQVQGNGQIKVVPRQFMGDIWCQQNIKINQTDKQFGLSLDVMGIISIDTRILLMKTQKLEKKSLNDYLEANGLDKKLDVSFRDMNWAFKILTSGQKSDQAKQIMQDVFKYCIYDCEACFLLWAKRNILPQAIEVAKLSFTPLKYSFLNADGIKVRNMVAKFAYDKKFSVPMTTKSQDIRIRDIQLLNKYEKYPGAYVSPPKKGISATPVSALDFNSLYPSIIMAHNLSPEKVVEPFEVLSSNIQTFKIEIPFQKGDQSEVLVGNVLTRDHNAGIYPEILQFLFASRKEVKQAMEDLQEQADKTEDIQKKKDLEFQATLLNCKQLAIKVFMNTFYGETGNQKSPLFDVIISGGTTTLGQKYIKQVHHYIENQDCEIVYGDTDSVYFRPRLSHFLHYREEKGESINNKSLAEQLLESAFEATEKLKNEINKFIGQQTDNFLKMAFEELLLPSMFTGKKKYCGVVYVPGKMSVKKTLTIKDILLRGIDFIKSQYPEIIKQFGRDTLISIMRHFMTQFEQFNNQHLELMFSDQYRDSLNLQLKDLIAQQILNLNNRLISIKPDEYYLLSSKKKLRSAKTGQMMLFRQRFTNISDSQSNLIFSSLKEFALQIDVQQLQSNGIAIPEDGEILDLISIKIPLQDQISGLKASDLIHLLPYVQYRQLPINHKEYLKMYRTTASRILVSTFSNIASVDGSDDLQEKEAIKQAKIFCDSISKSNPVQQQQVNRTQNETNQLLHELDKRHIDLLKLIEKTINNIDIKLESESCDGIYKQLYRDLTFNFEIRKLLYILLDKQEMNNKLILIEEQCQLQPSLKQQQSEIISGISKLLTGYQEFRLLPIIIRTTCLIQSQLGYCTSERVVSLIGIMIQIYEWQIQASNTIQFIEINKKLPLEMSESQNWLFKQRLLYIERLKQSNKKTEIQMPIINLIENELIPGSMIIQDFFSDSIWDYNYQLFKKDQNSQKEWIKQQIQSFKQGQLANAKILKIQKVNSELLQ